MKSNPLLSDELYIELDLDREYLNTYFNYTVTKKNIYDTNEEIVYNGRVYYHKSYQRIWLTDIICTHAINFTTRLPSKFNTVNEVAYQPTPTQNIIQSYYVKLYQDSALIKTYSIENVLSYYKDLDLPKGEYIDLDGNSFYNLLEQRTKILPRIPKLKAYENDIPGFSNNFFFSVLWIAQNNFDTNSKIGDRLIYKLVAKNDSGYTLNYIDYDSFTGVHSENIDGYDLSQLTAANPKEIGICAINRDNINSEVGYKKVANIDLVPADYYLIWYDRTGAYQCQPFSRKSIHTENITNNNLVNVIEETRPYEKLIEDKWTINSDWLTEEEYKAYESILTSPYLYLYDSKLNTGWWVNCSDRAYTQKTYKNQKKLFNMTVNVTANKNQRLVY